MDAHAPGSPATERLTGWLVYGTASVVLAVGAVWWLRAAPPPDPVGEQLQAWGAAVEAALPDDGSQLDGATVLLTSSDEQHSGTDVGVGPHRLRVTCAGLGMVRVDVSPVAGTGRVPCADAPEQRGEVVTMPLELTGTLDVRLALVRGDRAVVRWQLLPGS